MASKASDANGRAVNPWRIAGWGTAVAVILLPLAAMQFTREVNWTLGDFVFAAVIIGGVGLLFELAVRKTRSGAYRGGVAVALGAAFLTTWVNLAVGIVGNEDNPLNLLFFGVIGIAAVGAVVARLRSRGMGFAMAAAAAAHGAIGLTLFVADVGASEPPGPIGLLGLNAAFTGLWALSALLFRRSARQPL